MARTIVLLSLLGAGLAFGTACATLALMGLGVPMLVGALAASAAAGLVLHAALLALAARPAAAQGARLAEAEAACAAAEAHQAAAAAHQAQVEARAATLRHDLRGVLSPALMVTDRLLNSPDPAVQRAGKAVVRSIERATAIIQESKTGQAAAGGTAGAAQPAAPPGPAAG